MMNDLLIMVVDPSYLLIVYVHLVDSKFFVKAFTLLLDLLYLMLSLLSLDLVNLLPQVYL